MEFRKPLPQKRHSDSAFSSPCNRKKAKLLSTTIVTPETSKMQDDPFDDNFSQFFQSQFIREISNAETLIPQRVHTSTKSSFNDYNFTQIDGLTQFFNDSDFENSITSGQRCIANELVAEKVENEQQENIENDAPKEVKKDDNENWQFTSHIDDELDHFEGNEQNEEKTECKARESDLLIQSSQAFLNELSTLQMNISSIVNETINANKICTQDFIDPSQAQFEVYRSNVTQSQYMHRKRPNDIIEKILPKPHVVNPIVSTELNTEMIEDQLLAEMVLTTQTLARNAERLEDQLLADIEENDVLEISERLNECIDPDSSALDLYSDEDEKGNNQNEKEAAPIMTKIEAKEQQPSKIIPHAVVTAMKQPVTMQHSPVTAANFYSMGPFFGLPLRVKKLIQNYKNIDDLYGNVRMPYAI